MRRLTLLALVPVLGAAQVWEKPIAPGLTYRMEVDRVTPRMIHVLILSPKAPGLQLLPELAGGTVYEDGPDRGRKTVSEIARDSRAIVAINADYFPYTGDPLGLMVRGGQILSAPWPGRAAFAWGPNATMIEEASLKIIVQTSRGQFTIDGLNQDCGLNSLAINTPAAGIAIAKSPAACAIVRVEGGVLGPNGVMAGRVDSVVVRLDRTAIPEGCVALVGQGAEAVAVGALRPGDDVRITTVSKGFDWTQLDHVIGGGPRLVVRGKVAVDAEAAGFKADFSERRHPRTAVGVTAGGEIVMVAVDGRQSISAGATLAEMAAIMVRLGCVSALNLDGGGSTDLVIGEVVMNRPSDGKERPVANALVVKGRWPDSEARTSLALVLPPSGLRMGSPVTISVTAGGRPVPNAEVFWAAQGDAWVDQGGTLTALKPGQATISAWCSGRVLTGSLATLGLDGKN